MKGCPGLVLALSVFVVACGGGSDGSGSPPPIDASPVDDGVTLKGIAGTVNNASTGAPIAGATITTSPSSEIVTTDADGAYAIDDSVNESGRYQVTASKLGFRPVQREVSVAESRVSTADFQLSPIVSGLAASVPSLAIGVDRFSSTFILTSTSPDTGFAASAGEPWLRVIPESGVLAENESRLVRVEIDREGLAGTRAATQLVINTNNGLSGVVLDVTVELQASEPPASDPTRSPDMPPDGAPPRQDPPSEVASGEPSLPGADQSDCRRADVLQIALGDTRAPPVAFPQTTVLPGGEGGYTITTIPFSVFVDSYDLRAAGTLSIDHVSGGQATTDSLLFDLDRNSTYREYAAEVDVAGRTRLSATLEPGIYCYVLSDETGLFMSFSQLGLDVGFVAE